jgi:hypothetical protein
MSPVALVLSHHAGGVALHALWAIRPAQKAPRLGAVFRAWKKRFLSQGHRQSRRNIFISGGLTAKASSRAAPRAGFCVTAFCGATGASLSAQFFSHGRSESGLRQKQTQSETDSVGGPGIFLSISSSTTRSMNGSARHEASFSLSRRLARSLDCRKAARRS